MIYQVQNMQITKSHPKFASHHMQKWFCILQIDLAFTVISKYKNCPEISELIFYTKSGLLALQDDGKRERERQRIKGLEVASNLHEQIKEKEEDEGKEKGNGKENILVRIYKVAEKQ